VSPETDRPHHVLANPEVDHRLLLIDEELRLLDNPMDRLRKPSIPARKAFVSGNSVLHGLF
jgi:hypothetical protein